MAKSVGELLGFGTPATNPKWGQSLLQRFKGMFPDPNANPFQDQGSAEDQMTMGAFYQPPINRTNPHYGNDINPFSNQANLIPSAGGIQARPMNKPRTGLEIFEENPGMMDPTSKLGGMAKAAMRGGKNFFGSMVPGSGQTVANAFGKTSLGKAGGMLSKVGALPGWSIPAAAAAAWQINKRLGQKAHQKDLRKFEDQVRGMTTQEQYESGLQKPEHSRHGGMLGRLFRR